ncbi:galactonate dehydratase [uncultured Paludibaculum sp.]|uniref:galactonate dehydratase n=1 Tax=uncultured Paludibaculum sp. TaxID=1765020 RepID=UPI002AAAEBB4|nr:galactonate dehydratase [uncultured Paludibaculum sp.]
MKIRELRAYVVHAFRCNWVFVKVDTDEGISGVGEGTVEMREPTVASAIEELSRYLIGKDPFAIEHHIHVMNRDSYWRDGVILRSALSAVEAALFDIKGKALGVPVYELLGGQCRDRVKCYANGWFAGAETPQQFAAAARAPVAMGFQALKFDPFGKAYRTLSPAERETAVETVAAIRAEVGPNVDLLIEAHGRLDVPTAIRVGEMLAPYHPYWYEEPVPPDSIDALRAVREKVSTPIAAGERYFQPQRFVDAFNRGAIDIPQPDVCHVGGMLETKRVAGLSELYGLTISPHNPNGPIANAMTLQLAASTPNFGMLETMLSDVDWRDDVVHETLEMVDGCLLIPDTPGLGVELDEAAAAAHPYEARDLRHYTGALTRIRPANARPWFTVRSTSDVQA